MELKKTINTLLEQIYPSPIEILIVIDGAKQNKHTYASAMKYVANSKQKSLSRRNKTVRLLPKWQRGGRVSTLNTGLSEARYNLIINVDGDTSFDNDMALKMAKSFHSQDVIACGGALRVRNHNDSFWTKMQALE